MLRNRQTNSIHAPNNAKLYLLVVAQLAVAVAAQVVVVGPRRVDGDRLAQVVQRQLVR